MCEWLSPSQASRLERGKVMGFAVFVAGLAIALLFFSETVQKWFEI